MISGYRIWILPSILALGLPVAASIRLAGTAEPVGSTNDSSNELLREVALPQPSSTDRLLAAPIFHSERIPFVPAPAPPPTPVQESSPPAFVLVGRIKGADGTEYAYVRAPATNETIKMAVGDNITGWQLTVFTESGAILRSGDRQIHLSPDQGTAQSAIQDRSGRRARTRSGNNE